MEFIPFLISNPRFQYGIQTRVWGVDLGRSGCAHNRQTRVGLTTTRNVLPTRSLEDSKRSSCPKISRKLVKYGPRTLCSHVAFSLRRSRLSLASLPTNNGSPSLLPPIPYMSGSTTSSTVTGEELATSPTITNHTSLPSESSRTGLSIPRFILSSVADSISSVHWSTVLPQESPPLCPQPLPFNNATKKILVTYVRNPLTPIFQLTGFVDFEPISVGDVIYLFEDSRPSGVAPAIGKRDWVFRGRAHRILRTGHPGLLYVDVMPRKAIHALLLVPKHCVRPGLRGWLTRLLWRHPIPPSICLACANAILHHCVTSINTPTGLSASIAKRVLRNFRHHEKGTSRFTTTICIPFECAGSGTQIHM